MKRRTPSGNPIFKQSTKTGLLLVFVAALTLEATSLIQSYFTQQGLREEASRRAESQLKIIKDQILDIIDQAELAVRNNVWIASWSLDHPDTMHFVSRRIVEENSVVVGSTIALVPDYLPRRPLYSPYYYKQDGQILSRSLATEAYDYPSKEWFRMPLEIDDGFWSEPYIDTGGGDMLMTTFSIPIKDAKGRPAAVLTADLSLDWLTSLVGEAKVYPHSYNLMVSRTGRFMVSPIEEMIMEKTVGEVIADMKDSLRFQEAARSMLAGESGSMPVWFRGDDCIIYYAPIERTGWSMCTLIPDDDIYGASRRISWLVKLLQVLGLAMLVVILRSYIRNQSRVNDLNERERRMEGELRGAREIQMSMVPEIFPPFPERNDLDLAATLVPAKEVGGDLYDFFIRNGKLFSCIGDVSGKGIPASLVMAVTRTTFRNLSARENSPGLIVREMNDNLSAMNDNNMFVTFFISVLDLATGRLRYCNAGHNPPMVLSDDIRMLPVEPNLPLGVLPGMEYKEQEIQLCYDDAVFFYTDGLTEAENASHEQFGEMRVVEALRGRKGSAEHLDNIKEQVSRFVGDAPKSDDLTMLFIHYLGQNAPRRLVLHNDIQQLSRLPEFVESIGKEKGLEPETVSQINLALEEAVTNVILYAYPQGTDGLVEIEARAEGKALEFVISDSGTAFDPTARKDADIHASLQDRPIGGLGIHLIRHIMDSVRYERKNDRNVLTIIKKI